MPNYNKVISDTCVRIGEVRFSYVNVFSKRRNDDGSEGKFSACVLIPKENTDAVKHVNAAIENAKLLGKSTKWNGKIPGNCKSPLHDGDVERPDDDAFAGCWYLNASSNNKPGVRVLENGALVEALDGEDFYSGCYGAATLNFFPFENSGNRGVGAGLNNVLKTADGERLSGGRTAESDFGDLVDELA